MAGAKRPSSGTLEEMFRISTFGGVFPFVFKGNNLVISYKFFIYSILYIILVSCITAYYLIEEFRTVPIFLNYSNIFNMTIPHILPLVVCNASIFWHWMNLNRFNKMFASLKIVEDGTDSYSITRFSYRKQYFYLFSVATLFLVIHLSCTTFSVSLAILLYLMMTNVYLVMLQFTSLLATIKNYYSFFEDTLCIATATEWVQYHEVLGSCCEIVNKCYSPQLLIFTVLTFMYVTSSIYIMITNTYYFLDAMNRVLALSWVVLVAFSLWVFVHHCHETVEKAKNFDKSLSRLVLNDRIGKLLQDKRIIYHFKMKHKVEFSAMGFFNYDYPLLCRMVSTATTYIAVLVQFSS